MKGQWLTIGLGAVLASATGCMHEQKAAQIGHANARPTAAQLQQQVSQQNQVIRDQRAAADRLRQQLSTQNQVIQDQRAQMDRAEASRASRETVPIGSAFTIRLERPISSAKEGELITGHLVKPMYGSDGVMVAAPGAVVTAEVVRVQRAPTRAVDVAFRDIETVDGATVPLGATVADQQTTSALKAEPADPNVANADFDATLSPKPRRQSAAVGGGPPPDTSPKPVKPPSAGAPKQSPQGPALDLVLTQPLSRASESR